MPALLLTGATCAPFGLLSVLHRLDWCALMMPSSSLFAIDGDNASGHWYLHEYTRDLEGTASTILSRYVDTYVKQDGQWLFKTRAYDFIYNGPSDLSGTYTPL